MRKQWVDILGIVGLLSGLVFVGLEIRQNTQAVHGATVQAGTDLQTEVILRGMEDPLIQSTWRALEAGQPYDEFEPEEAMKLGWFFAVLTNLEENRYRQIALGTADEAMLGLVNNYLSNRGFQQWWENRLAMGRDAREEGFVTYLNARIAEAQARGPSIE